MSGYPLDVREMRWNLHHTCLRPDYSSDYCQVLGNEAIDLIEPGIISSDFTVRLIWANVTYFKP